MTCCGWTSDDRRRPETGPDAGRQETKTLRIALLGCGSVGSQVARLLREQADDLAVRTGARLELAGIAVRRPAHPRAAGIDRGLLTADARGLATRPDVDIVVEVIGGIEPARSLLLAAMKAGKSVVTANKALLAENGAEIHGAAREHGTDLYYEAAVAGAIPLLRPLRESLAGDTVHRVLGIVNGTTNYILDRMDSSGAGFTEALEEAQSMGYAEADPTADVEGFDAAAKAAILAGLAFHTEATAADVHREGITESPPPTWPAPRAGLRGEAARHLRTVRRRGIGPGAPGNDPALASAGLGRRCLQRGLRRSRLGGPADVLWRGRGRVPYRQRGARRSRRGGAEPAGRHSWPRRVHLRGAARDADGADAHPLPCLARRRRPARRAGSGRRRVRPPRRVHPRGPPGHPWR